ncbi:MAG: carbohydrate ABC transporter permease [Clostridia bacterium]|nr:carbohydrate ABC transporter permease [Clostridia bacterium]
MKVKENKTDRIFDVCNWSCIIIFFLIVLYPLYYIVIASVSDPQEVMNGNVLFAPAGLTLEGFKRVLAYEGMYIGYKNTVFYTVAGTIINLVVTLAAGYSLSRPDLYARKFFTSLFVMTMFFSGGLIPTFLIVKSYGMYNTIWPMLLLGAVNVWNLIITKSFFENNIPVSLLESAQLDGCDDMRFFFKMALPLSKAIIAVLTVYYAVGHWNSYFNAFIYLKDEDKFPLQLFLRQILLQNQFNDELSIESSNSMESMFIAESMKYGMIILSTLPILMVYPFVQKFFVQGVMIGAIKG